MTDKENVFPIIAKDFFPIHTKQFACEYKSVCCQLEKQKTPKYTTKKIHWNCFKKR